MVLQRYSLGPRILFANRMFFGFQGHYVNRYKDDIHGQCHGIEQKRNFLNFANASRTRKYCGRQLIGYTMEQMFEVVSDVGNYHKFVPWCKQSIILMKKSDCLKADLIVGFPPINERYTSHVTLVKPYLVKAECSDGKLFHNMLTLWRFSPGLKKVQQSCVVDFHITFEFRSAVHSQLSNLFFDQVARQMECAFIKEVGVRNGQPTMEPRNLLSNNALKS